MASLFNYSTETRLGSRFLRIRFRFRGGKIKTKQHERFSEALRRQTCSFLYLSPNHWLIPIAIERSSTLIGLETVFPNVNLRSTFSLFGGLGNLI